MNKLIRCRYAPSPTGYLHLGGLRTALFNALLALKHDGKFILRIEDTDRSRLVEDAARSFEEELQWLGIPPDEGPLSGGQYGPYTQSQRRDLYAERIRELHACGHAYRCFCTPQTLEDLRARQQRTSRGAQSFYDRRCAHLTPEQVAAKLQAGVPHTFRLRVPGGASTACATTTVQDALRGPMVFQNALVDDQILVKSDGMPTYHFASVVDDHEMRISHVIRGEEWVMSSPKHQMLYDAFGWEPPQFVHLPLLLNAADRSKLSKRQRDVGVRYYREQGFLPPAILNFVAFLGWNPAASDRESDQFLSLQQLAERFKLEDLHRSPAVVDQAKLRWFNAHYLKELATSGGGGEGGESAVLGPLKALIEAGFPGTPFEMSEERLGKLVKLAVLDGRIALLSEICERFGYLFSEDALLSAAQIVERAGGCVSEAQLEELLKGLAAAYREGRDLLATVKEIPGIPRKQAFKLLRLIITGSDEGPPLVDIIALMPPSQIGKRLEKRL